MMASIMQPYFFPYLGYFQLMAASDVFVFHDDVQFVKGSWVNRNRILNSGYVTWLTMPVAGAAHHEPINRRDYTFTSKTKRHLLNRVCEAYRSAPHFESTFDLVRRVLSFEDANVARFNMYLLSEIGAALGIKATLVTSSELRKNNQLRAEARVIELCKVVGAKTYINPIGGAHLYETGRFASEGIVLNFLQATLTPYAQATGSFEPSLSIIDVMMNNELEVVRDMLSHYKLVAPSHGLG